MERIKSKKWDKFFSSMNKKFLTKSSLDASELFLPKIKGVS